MASCTDMEQLKALKAAGHLDAAELARMATELLQKQQLAQPAALEQDDELEEEDDQGEDNKDDRLLVPASAHTCG